MGSQPESIITLPASNQRAASKLSAMPKNLNISHPDEARLPRLPDSIDQPITVMPQSRMKVRSPRSTPPPSPTPSSAPIDSAPLEEQGEEGMDTVNDEPQSQEEVPVATKSRASRRSSSLPRVIGGSWWR
ncbi:hypothetical protein TNCV_892941 [Trichonephila clavipes]|nr:hypothetical protein TNCV_892941 [Trichonephila clavipes]